MKAALFDVDGTLLAGPHSSEALFIRHLLRRGVIGPRQMVAAAWFMLARGARYGRHGFRKNKAYLAGLTLGTVAGLAQEFVEGRLAALIDRDVLRRMDEHRRDGDRVLLLTGTPAFLAAPLAETVGADGWLAARYALRGDRFLAAPPVCHPLGAEKVAHAADLCARHGADLAEAAAYADSIHDLPLLLQVARPVAVRPDRRLAAEARARGWETVGTAAGAGSGAARHRTRPA